MAADRVARIHAIVNTTAVSALTLKVARATDGNARDQIHIPLRPRNVRISGMIAIVRIVEWTLGVNARLGIRGGIRNVRSGLWQ